MARDLIDGESIRATVKRWFEDSYGQSPYEIRLDIGDGNVWYQPIDPDEVTAILSADERVDRRLYKRGHFDCEDFAIASRAAVTHHTLGPEGDKFAAPPAFGLLFSNTHATNIGIDQDHQPYLFDWFYDLVWQQPSLEGALKEEIGVGWSSPRSIRYILI